METCHHILPVADFWFRPIPPTQNPPFTHSSAIKPRSFVFFNLRQLRLPSQQLRYGGPVVVIARGGDPSDDRGAGNQDEEEESRGAEAEEREGKGEELRRDLRLREGVHFQEDVEEDGRTVKGPHRRHLRHRLRRLGDRCLCRCVCSNRVCEPAPGPELERCLPPSVPERVPSPLEYLCCFLIVRVFLFLVLTCIDL